MRKAFRKIMPTVFIGISIIFYFCLGCYSAPHSHEFENGKCVLCGEICEHEWIDGRCTVCGIILSNTVEDLPSKSENGNIFGRMYLPSVYYGKLKTIIVCHGFGVNSTNAVPTYLARRGYACYAFDFCGGSRQTRSDMDMDDMTILTEKADLLAVYDTVTALPYVDENNVYLYGESQGGLVCSVTAVELKDEISGMILMYPGFSMPSQIALEYRSIYAVPDRIRIGSETLNHSYAEAMFEFIPERFEVTDSALHADIMRNRLDITSELYDYISDFDKKTVIFHGTKDELVDIAFSEEAVKHYKNAVLYKMHGEGHGFGINALDKTIERIDEFLKK